MQELAFSEEEFQGRAERVRNGIAARGLDALLVTTPENIYYLTGFSTPGYYQPQALILPRQGSPVFFTYGVEAELARGAALAKAYAEYGPTDRPMPRLAAALGEHGLASARIGIEKQSWFFSVALFEELAGRMPAAKLSDGSGVVESCRAVKSAAEIEYISAGAKIAGASMKAAMGEIRPGRSENDIAAAAYDAAIRAGGEYPGSPPYVSSGPRVEIQHASWARRVLQAGDEVVVELSGCMRRYSGSLERTFLIQREPTGEIRRLEAAIVSGLTAAIERLRPGVLSGEVDAACRDVVKAAGFSYPHETGYSIGVCYPPGWNETHVFNIKPGDKRPIQANMTFHLVPHVAVPGVGAFGASETVVVREEGAEVLTDFPRELIQV